MLHMRPVFERLRDELEAPYPFASARLWLEPQGREIVARVQDELGEELEESLFVVRTNDRLLPIDWSPPSIRFRDAVEWSAEPEHEKVIILVWADGTDHKIEINPRRSFGEPVVRDIKTSALADAWRASLAVLPSPSSIRTLPTFRLEIRESVDHLLSPAG
jgi:hypothetical protein